MFQKEYRLLASRMDHNQLHQEHKTITLADIKKMLGITNATFMCPADLSNNFAGAWVSTSMENPTHCEKRDKQRGSEEIVQVPAQGLTKADLMGELALMHTLPTYQ